MRKIKSFDYLTVFKYILLFLGFLIFEKLETTPLPYSTAILAVSLINGCSVIITPLLYILSFLVFGATGLMLTAACAGITLAFIIIIYKKFNSLPKYEMTFYTIVALTAFIVAGDTNIYISLEKRILISLFTAILTFISTISVKTILDKGLKYKFGYEEFAAICATIIVLGVGICNITFPSLWKFGCVFTLLFACHIYKLGVCTLISAIISIPLAVYYGNITYISLFLVYGVTAESLMPLSRHLSSIAVVLCDVILQMVFNIYGSLDYTHIIPVIGGALLFSCIPSKPLAVLKDKLLLFREKQIVRQTINRNRITISNRLYELSSVFSDMSVAFNLFKKTGLNEEKAKEIMIKEVFDTVCKDCTTNTQCHLKNSDTITDLQKMLDIGFAKGRISLIDFPETLNLKCNKPNNLLYGLNRLIADYRAYNLNYENVNNGRELIAREAEGVSDILKGLAFETGTLLKYQSKLEKNISEELFKKGFLVSEILIYGENESLSLSLILTMKEFNLTELSLTLTKVLGRKILLYEKNIVSEDKCYLAFKVAAKFDAVFGIANAIKDGSSKSGDTHSIIRLKEDKFLVALSDGMGSGEKAESLSSVSLSLIENFYKAGLKSEIILNTVNRLLSFNEEDDFTALDVSIVNLKSGTVDFIKYGSPYGFIISKEGIRIIEGNSLPLGILTELKPSVCTTEIKSGDMILLVTDGISDAFKDSSTLIDYLRTLPAKNPQTLSDNVLQKAIELSKGDKKDDMTALAVRILKST